MSNRIPTTGRGITTRRAIPLPVLADDVTHVSKYFALIPSVYADKTAALQAAHDSLDANGGILQLPVGTHIIDNATLNKPIVLQGVAGSTWLQPGASGTIFTSDYQGTGSRNGSFTLRDVSLGDPAWPASSVARSYATPLVNFINWSGELMIDRVYARIANTGTLFRFASSGNLSINNSHLYTWQYGMPFVFEQRPGGAFEADTISFNNTMMYGRYGGIFRTESGTYTVSWNTAKFVVSGTQTLLDHSLAVDAAAAATTITLQAGQGASWAIDDSIYLCGDYATESAARTGNTAEVNRVTGVSGDVLTLSQPLQFAHGTNSNAFTVQALRGGVGLSICSNTGTLKGDQTHFEALAWAIIDYGSVGSEWTNSTYSTNRFIRLAGRVQDLTVGPTRTDGGGGQNILLELPSWTIAGANTDRYYLHGPWDGASQPSVLDSGTALTMDLIHTGALFRSKNYVAWDIVSGAPRISRHNGTASAFVAQRYGYSTNPDQIKLAYGGSVTGQDFTVASVTAGLPGAVQASRYVGATTSGPPGTGAFLVGDFIITQAGRVWVCIVAGSPGTWVPGSHADREAALLRGSATVLRQSFDQRSGTGGNVVAGTVSGTLVGAIVPVLAGDSLNRLTFHIVGAAVFGSNADGHWYGAVYSEDGLTLLANTADQGTTALGAGTTPYLTLTGTYTPAVDARVIVCCMIYPGTGGSPAAPSLAATTAFAPNAGGKLPLAGVSGSSSLTSGTPPSTFGTIAGLGASPFTFNPWFALAA